MALYIFIALGIMIIFGALGGLVNFYWSYDEKTEFKRKLIKAILSGVIGAIIIPLVLQMISNSCLDWMKTKEFSEINPVAFMIFIAFCAIGGVSGEALLRTVSSKLIKMIEEANNRALANEDRTKGIESAISESEKDDNNVNPLMAQMNILPDLDDKENQIIDALKNSRFYLRSISGISKQTSMGSHSVQDILKELEKKGIVGSFLGTAGILKWYLK
ncbi:MAG: YEATS-associated helix-containing protein [Bacteroidales bacterium]|jgi:hypothetical protein